MKLRLSIFGVQFDIEFEPVEDGAPPLPAAVDARREWAARWLAAKSGFSVHELLENSNDAVRSAYRVAAKLCHPDAGGSIEEWDKLTNAKDILSGVPCGSPRPAPVKPRKRKARKNPAKG